MIRRLRCALGARAFGGAPGGEAADAAVGRGMADVLSALDNVIDDEATLGSIYAELGNGVPGAAADGAAGTAADEARGRTGRPQPAITTARAGGPAASRRRPAPRKLARRQVALRSAAGAAAALAAGAVALVAVGVPGAGQGGAAAAVNTAYVVKRLDGALNAAGPGAIAQMTVTTRSAGVTTTAQEWSYGNQWRSATNSPAGHPAYDEGLSHGVYTVVSYPARAWARNHESGRVSAPALGPSGCEPVIAGFPLFPSGLPAVDVSAGSLPAAVARNLRAAISCGALAGAGRQRVDGVEAIKLTSRSASPIAETIWVSPGTYLPVRVVIRPASGQQGPWQTADITWLKPTARNLAMLTVPVPAGFRHVRSVPILDQLSGGSAVKAEPAP
jgi:hypothetical protein